MFRQTDVIDVARRFGLKLRAIHDDLTVSGSPERTTFRTVIEDDQGRLYVVQAFTKSRVQRKRAIAQTIAHLHDSGLRGSLPFHPTVSGDLVLPNRDHYWQVRPYLEGVSLPRPRWVQDSWRGDALAELLLEVRRHGAVLPERLKGEAFFVRRYVARISADMAEHHAHLLPAVEPVLDHLARYLWPVLDDLPIAFCHGDVHPLNVIWGTQRILALIDWEFCGLKPELYDLANLIGCVGVEDPDALSGPLVSSLVGRLYQNTTYARQSWEHLPDLVLAIRFAWLAEWLRKDDREMIELESDYMRLLLASQTELARRWRIG